MARKKRDQPRLSADIIRNSAAVLIIVTSLFFLGKGLFDYVRSSSAFIVREIRFSGDLQDLGLAETGKIKGQRIFTVDLKRVEALVRERYPALADIRVLRRLPDQIIISGVKRESFAAVVLGGRSFAADRDGWLICAADKVDGPLVVIKGLQDQRAVPGERIKDTDFLLAVEVAGFFTRARGLSAFPLQMIDISDAKRIVCTLGGVAELQVYLDGSDLPGRVRILETLLSHGGLDFSVISYIDLRFKEPVIGKKKARKT